MIGIVEALIRASSAKGYPPFRGPVKLTAAQARRLLSESPVAEQPTDEEWEALVAAGLPDSTVLGLPIELVAADEESTPWANGWRPADDPAPEVALETPRLNRGGLVPSTASRDWPLPWLDRCHPLLPASRTRLLTEASLGAAGFARPRLGTSTVEATLGGDPAYHDLVAGAHLAGLAIDHVTISVERPDHSFYHPNALTRFRITGDLVPVDQVQPDEPPTAEDAAALAATLREIADQLELQTPEWMRFHVAHALTFDRPQADSDGLGQCGQPRRLQAVSLALRWPTGPEHNVAPETGEAE